MDSKKVVNAISRAGSVVVTTLTSFLVAPPVIEGPSKNPVTWSNIFTFFAGVLSIVIYDNFKRNAKRKKYIFLLLPLLVICICGYEVLYNQYSVKCFEKIDVVISNGKMRDTAAIKYAYWKTHSQNPMESLLESNHCSSIEIWPMSEIAIPYYSMLLLYFGMIIILVILLVLVSDILNHRSTHDI